MFLRYKFVYSSRNKRNREGGITLFLKTKCCLTSVTICKIYLLRYFIFQSYFHIFCILDAQHISTAGALFINRSTIMIS